MAKRNYERVTHGVGIILILGFLSWLIYLNTLALITPFNEDGAENFAAMHSISMAENPDNSLNFTFSPTRWVVRTMIESPKLLKVFLWFVAFVYDISFILGIPYIIVMTTEIRIWPLSSFRRIMFGDD